MELVPITAGWDNFFVAEAGAAAALSGLLFVALSVNVGRILQIETLPARAVETLFVVLTVLVVATFGLVPGQSGTALGTEIFVTGLFVWGVVVREQVRAYRNLHARRWLFTRAVVTQIATVPFIVAGALLFLGCDRALYWIVPGTIASFAAGVLNAWVLLVEILR